MGGQMVASAVPVSAAAHTLPPLPAELTLHQPRPLQRPRTVAVVLLILVFLLSHARSRAPAKVSLVRPGRWAGKPLNDVVNQVVSNTYCRKGQTVHACGHTRSSRVP
jgi:hypothetical protein